MSVNRTLRYSFIGSILLGCLPAIAHTIALIAISIPAENWLVDILFVGMSVIVGGIMSGLKLLMLTNFKEPKLMVLIPVLLVGVFSIAITYGLILSDLITFAWWLALASLGGVCLFGLAAYVIDVSYTAKAYERATD